MNQPELTRLLQEVGAVPAPAADYGAVVRASVARGRLVRTAVLAVVGLAVVGALAAGAVALSGGEDTVEAIATPTPTASPTPSEEPSPTAEPTAPPTAEPTVVPTAPPTVAPTTPAPPPTTQPEPTAAPTTKRPTPRQTTAKPKPFVGNGLVVSLSGPRSTSSQTVTFSISIKDTDGKILSATLEYGDGSSPVSLNLGATCGKRSGTDPEPLSVSTTRQHTYTNSGSFTAVLRVRTGSSCRPTPQESDDDIHEFDIV